MATEVGGFPQTSSELDKWKAQGRTFSGGKWFEKEPTSNLTNISNQVNEISSQASNIGTNIQDLNAANLNDSGAVTVPSQTTNTPDMTDTNSMVAFFKKQYEEQKAEADRIKKEKEAAKLKKEADAKKFRDKHPILGKYLSGEETVGGVREAQFQKLGVDPAKYFADRAGDIAEMESMMEEYNNVEASMNAQVDAVAQPGVFRSVVDTEVNRIRKDFNVKLSQISSKVNTKAAVMEMKQGNFNEAKAFVNQAVADYTYDLKLQTDLYNQFRDENQTIIDDLDDEYKSALDDAQTASFNAWTSAVAEKEKVGDLLLQYPDAGISLDDTPDEALAKAGVVAAADKAAAIKKAEGEIDALGFSGAERESLSNDVNEMLKDADEKPRSEADARAQFDALKAVVSAQFGDRGEEAIGVLARALDKAFPPESTTETNAPFSTPNVDPITGKPVKQPSPFVGGEPTTGQPTNQPSNPSFLNLDANGNYIPPEQDFINSLFGAQ